MIVSCKFAIICSDNLFVLWVMMLLETIVGPTIWVHFKLIVKTKSHDNLLVIVAARSQLVSIGSRSFPAQVLLIIRRKMATVCTRDGLIDEKLNSKNV
jgi:hypothetical protein